MSEPFKTRDVVLTTLLGSALVVIGFLATFSLRSYAAYWERTASMIFNEFRVVGTVHQVSTEVNPPVLVVQTEDSRVSRTGRFAAIVTKDTLLFSQKPRIDNGVVVGYSDVQRITLAEVVPGTRVFIEVFISPVGLFTARRVVAGDPFPRE